MPPLATMAAVSRTLNRAASTDATYASTSPVGTPWEGVGKGAKEDHRVAGNTGSQRHGIVGSGQRAKGRAWAMGDNTQEPRSTVATTHKYACIRAHKVRTPTLKAHNKGCPSTYCEQGVGPRPGLQLGPVSQQGSVSHGGPLLHSQCGNGSDVTTSKDLSVGQRGRVGEADEARWMTRRLAIAPEGCRQSLKRHQQTLHSDSHAATTRRLHGRQHTETSTRTHTPQHR